MHLYVFRNGEFIKEYINPDNKTVINNISNLSTVNNNNNSVYMIMDETYEVIAVIKNGIDHKVNIEQQIQSQYFTKSNDFKYIVTNNHEEIKNFRELKSAEKYALSSSIYNKDRYFYVTDLETNIQICRYRNGSRIYDSPTKLGVEPMKSYRVCDESRNTVDRTETESFTEAETIAVVISRGSEKTSPRIMMVVDNSNQIDSFYYDGIKYARTES